MDDRQINTIHIHGTLAADAEGIIPMTAHVGATLLEVAAVASNVNAATLAIGIGGLAPDADAFMTHKAIGQSGEIKFFTVADFDGVNADPLHTSCPILGPQDVLTWRVNYDGAGTNEVQLVALTRNPTGGTFTLTYAGQTTGAIAYNASAATVLAALEALSNIGVGDVAVTGAAGGPWTVTFTGALEESNVAEMTGSAASLTGGDDEQQLVTITGAPTGGTFTLTYAGQTTAGIAYNANGATVQTALRLLSNITPDKVTVAGAAGGPWTVTFAAALAATNVAEMTGSGASLTGGTTPAVAVTTPVSGSPPILTVTTPTAGVALSAAANVDLVFTLLLGAVKSSIPGLAP